MSSPIFFFFFVFLLSLPTNQAQDLVTTTCDQCIYKDLCKTTLASSGAKDLTGLAKAAVQALSAQASDIKKQVDASLATSTEPIKQHINACSEAYDAVLPHLTEALTALDAKDYQSASIQISAGIRNQRSCEKGFKKAELKSPFIEPETKFAQLGSMSLTITDIARRSPA